MVNSNDMYTGPTIDVAFELLDTYGLPLYITMEKSHEAGLPVNLTAFKEDAMRANWKPEKIRAVIEEAFFILRGTHCYFVLLKEEKR
jgi:alanyl-tRNA synthetase